ncbi:hypothetical protein GCM10009623_20500 [Nocardioides aestuarii]|uniref:DsbA family protein n=1 Tax=Nocardioides aestuarii TaxID=252231 RepID=A0ABW4TN43_9ACTN
MSPEVDSRRDHIRGRTDAPMTLVEYGDFECPYCGRATGAVNDVLRALGAEVRYVLRHLPLINVHAHAQSAAELAERVAASARFWDAHDLLFSSQARLGPGVLFEIARQLGLPSDDEVDPGAQLLRVQRARRHSQCTGQRCDRHPTLFLNGSRHTGPGDAATLIRALRSTGLPR